MTRQTSIDVYHQIKKEGLLSKIRLDCYELLINYSPITAGQLMKKAKEINPNMSHQRVESLKKRLSELVRLGVAAELGTVECPVSKRNVILWGVTSNLPVDYKKPLSKTDRKIREAIQKEREECARIADSYSEIAATIIRNRI